MNWGLTCAGFVVGAVVGLTGMGGGALMTPVLVLFFGIQPLAAVSSDLVASAVMKPFGSLVHLRRGTVNLELVRWLVVGSVPAAFCGVFVARAVGPGRQVQSVVKLALGVALIVAAAGIVAKAYLHLRDRAHGRARGLGHPRGGPPAVVVRPAPTVAIGLVGGLIVGMTSVGSGSLIIVALLLVYPSLKASELVGTDLVQAVPLVLSAAVAHLVFGDFRLDVTAALLVGSIPGVLLGATLSARAPGGVVRRSLALVLVASGLKLLGVGNVALVGVLAGVVVLGPPLWMWVRTRHGFTPLARHEVKQAGQARTGASVRD